MSSVLLTYRVNFYLFKNRDLEPEEFYLLLPLMKAVLVASWLAIGRGQMYGWVWKILTNIL